LEPSGCFSARQTGGGIESAAKFCKRGDKQAWRICLKKHRNPSQRSMFPPVEQVPNHNRTAPPNSLYWHLTFDKLAGLVRKENKHFLIYGQTVH
jgi:hypothetical protein